MHDPSPVNTGAPAATTASGRALSLGGAWFAGPAGDELERDRLLGPARESDAGRQLVRCFVRWARALEHVRLPALRRLADNQPVDPNDPDVWRSRDEHAQAVLRRHGLTRLNAGRLTMAAVSALIDGQARADRDAGLDWTTITVPAARLDERLRRAHARLPIALDDPAVYAHRDDQRRALADRLAVGRTHADDLSRWVLTHPDAFDPSDLRCWRIGSPTWLELADEQLDPVDRVQRPVGMFVLPAMGAAEGWQLIPVLSLDAIRLIVALGGRLERDLGSAVLPARAAGALLERVNVHTLHAGPRECLDSAAQLAHELSRELGSACRSVQAFLATSATVGGACSSDGAPTRAVTDNASPSSRCASSPSPRASSPSAGWGPRPATSATRSPARSWTSARPSRPRLSAACRCCSPPRPPASSRTPSASAG